MLRTQTLALLLLFTLLGSGAGYLAAGSMQQELRIISGQLSALRQTSCNSRPEQDQPESPPARVPAEWMDEFALIIREAVSDTLQPYYFTGDAPVPWQPPPEARAMFAPPGPTPNPEVIRAGTEQAEAILAAAIDLGTWDRNIAREFANAVYALPDDALAEAYRKLSLALNNGELQLAEDAAPTLFLGGSHFNAR